MRQEEGRSIIKQLANSVDVLVENFRPGVMEKWKLGPKAIAKFLCFCAVSCNTACCKVPAAKRMSKLQALLLTHSVTFASEVICDKSLLLQWLCDIAHRVLNPFR